MLLRLLADRSCEVCARRETDTLVRRDGDTLPCLRTADGGYLPLFDLTRLERAEPGKDNTVSGYYRLGDAIEHCIERCISRSPGCSKFE